MCLRTHTWGESGNWFSPFYYNAKKDIGLSVTKHNAFLFFTS